MFRRLRYYLEMRGSRRSGGAPMPAERTWIHPSELPGSFERAVVPPAPTMGTRRYLVSVASAATALLAAGSLLLALPSASTPAGASIGAHETTTLAGVPSVDKASASTLLALVIYEGSHLGTATALVLPPGDLAVTTTPIPEGATVVAQAAGRASEPLTVLGTDRMLGVTVLRLHPNGRITPIGALGPALQTHGAPTQLTAMAAVRSVNTPMQFEYAPAYLNTYESAATLGRSEIDVTRGTSVIGSIAGTVVLDGDGEAVAVSAPALGVNAFVPATFLELLAQRIVLGDTAGHGWLQLEGKLAAGGGAQVVAITDDGASWRRLEVGDRIVAVNSVPVRTMADIGSILYTSSPGQPLDLTVVRGARSIIVDVTLAASP